MAINTHGIKVNITENVRKSFLKDKVSPKTPFQCIPRSNPREYSSFIAKRYGKPTANATIQLTQHGVLKRKPAYIKSGEEDHRSAKIP